MTAAPPAGPGVRPGAGRLRRVGGRPAGRTPFALLVVALLAAGLIALLMLNTALDQGSFALSRLQKQTSRYTQEQQALQQRIDRQSAPGALAQLAQRLGMVPGGDPAFLTGSGQVLGSPGRLPGPPLRINADQVPGTASASASAAPSATAAAGPGAAASAAPAGARTSTASPSGPAPSAGPSARTASAAAVPAMPTPTPTVVH